MSERRRLKDGVFMGVAHAMATLGTCRRAKVGCVLLRPDGSVAGTGYNGALPGQPHCTPEECRQSSRCFRTRHAERSALDYSQGIVETAYMTHEPCLRCTQDLIARGCKRVYWTYSYDIKDPIEGYWRARHVLSARVDWQYMEPDGTLYSPTEIVVTPDEELEIVATGAIVEHYAKNSRIVPNTESSLVRAFLKKANAS